MLKRDEHDERRDAAKNSMTPVANQRYGPTDESLMRASSRPSTRPNANAHTVASSVFLSAVVMIAGYIATSTVVEEDPYRAGPSRRSAGAPTRPARGRRTDPPGDPGSLPGSSPCHGLRPTAEARPAPVRTGPVTRSGGLTEVLLVELVVLDSFSSTPRSSR